jgi:hypothetical protein
LGETATNLNFTTKSGGCKECRYVGRRADFEEGYYKDSGSFRMHFNQTYTLDTKKYEISNSVGLDHFGIYTIVVQQTGSSSLWQKTEFTDVDPDYFWWPLITLVIIGAVTVVGRLGWTYLFKEKPKNFDDLETKFLMKVEEQNGNKSEANNKSHAKVEAKERLQCLDSFRGLTMFMMVILFRAKNLGLCKLPRRQL